MTANVVPPASSSVGRGTAGVRSWEMSFDVQDDLSLPPERKRATALVQPTLTVAEGAPRMLDATGRAFDPLEWFQEMLGDESKVRAPSVAAIYLPETAAQVAGALADLARRGQRCVLSAGRTGITGAVAPIDADAVVMGECEAAHRSAADGSVRGPGGRPAGRWRPPR